MSEDEQSGIERLLEVVGTLRGEGGCPWDREQTLDTLKQYLIEETYELVDAVDSGDKDHHLEELGDVLLQVVLQSQIRKEEGSFDFNDVANKLCDKLVYRHPHVFGDAHAGNPDEVLRNWEALKAKEKEGTIRSITDGIPRHLPELHKAHRIQTKVARVGFDWDREEDVVAKIDEELDELKESLAAGDEDAIREEVGDLLFSVVNLSRFKKMNAEEALSGTVRKFIKRFKEIERRIHEKGAELSKCSLDELSKHWEDIKKEEKSEKE